MRGALVTVLGTTMTVLARPTRKSSRERNFNLRQLTPCAHHFSRLVTNLRSLAPPAALRVCGLSIFSDLGGPVRRLDRRVQVASLFRKSLQLLAQHAHIYRRDLANL
jgi:hypothetical protein